MQLIKTKTEDGIEFTGMLFQPPERDRIILHIHGMSSDIYSSAYLPLMQEQYVRNGYAFLAVEHRGTHTITDFNTDEGVRHIGGAYEIFEDCVYDIRAWVKKAQEMGYKEIWLQSHSLGPSKTTYYMDVEEDNSIKGVIWISPSDIIGLVSDKIGRTDHEICIKEAHEPIGMGKGEQLLSYDLWGTKRLSAKTYVSLFGEGAKTAIFNYSDQSLGWDIVNKIKVPVIAFTGTEDGGIAPAIDPKLAMEILEKQLLNSPRKRTVVYNNAGHDFIGFEEQLVQDIIDFLIIDRNN